MRLSLDYPSIALFENWTRRLHRPGSLFVTRRDDAYFNDMARPWYLEAADRTVCSGCERVGFDFNIFQLEYPCQALLLQRDPAVRFAHTGVTNASARCSTNDPPEPCAVLCLECLGNAQKIALYRSVAQPIAIGRFLLFLNDSRPSAQ